MLHIPVRVSCFSVLHLSSHQHSVHNGVKVLARCLVYILEEVVKVKIWRMTRHLDIFILHSTR